MMFAGALLLVPAQKSFSQETLPSVEKIAERRSNHLKDALALSDKQYKKVYDIILAEENARKDYIENKRAAQPQTTPAKPVAEPKNVPPTRCPYAYGPDCDYYGRPCCPWNRGNAPEHPHKKHGKGAGVKGGKTCYNPQMRGLRMGLDSIRSDYDAKLIGVLNAEQTEKYLLISRPGQRPGHCPMPPADCDRPRPHHHHGYGRR